MTATSERARSRFLLEVALDHERLKARIAQRLRDHRESLRPKTSQMEMSRLIRVNGKMISYRQYQRWEAAESMPGWKHIEAIAAALKITADELLSSEDDAADEAPEASTGAAVPAVTTEIAAVVQELRAEAAEIRAERERLRSESDLERAELRADFARERELLRAEFDQRVKQIEAERSRSPVAEESA